MNVFLILLLIGNIGMTVFDVAAQNWPVAVFNGIVSLAISFILGMRWDR